MLSLLRLQRLWGSYVRPLKRLSGEGKLGVERLEDRRVLAGNVYVTFSNNTLTVNGDDLANSFSITRAGDAVLVSAASGTTLFSHGQKVDLGSRGYGVSDFSKLAIKINGKGGDDRITVGSTLGETYAHHVLGMKSLTIDTGAGADELNIDSVRINQTGTSKITLGSSSQLDADYFDVNGLYVVGGLDVLMGGGNDYFDFDSNTNVLRRLLVDLGAGDDSGYIDWGQYGSLNVKLGAGNDYFYTGLESSSFMPVMVGGDVTFDGGDGDDRLRFNHVDFKSLLSIKTGNGNDRVDFEGDLKVFSTATIDAGHGNNVVTMKKAAFSGALNVNAGTGNDQFTFGGDLSTTYWATKINAGSGNNVVNFKKTTLGGALTVTTGHGNDQIKFDGALSVNGKLTLTTNGGNDNVTIDSGGTVTGLVDANFGDGTNTFAIEWLSALGGFKYAGGSGIDTILVEDGLAAPTVVAKLGAGNDVVNIDGLAKSSTVAADKVEIDMGAGIDVLTGSYINVKDARIKLGAGNDVLSIVSSVISVYAQIDGGSDADHGYFTGTVPTRASGKLKISYFESGNILHI